jgi:hypothetical protein
MSNLDEATKKNDRLDSAQSLEPYEAAAFTFAGLAFRLRKQAAAARTTRGTTT